MRFMGYICLYVYMYVYLIMNATFFFSWLPYAIKFFKLGPNILHLSLHCCCPFYIFALHVNFPLEQMMEWTGLAAIFKCVWGGDGAEVWGGEKYPSSPRDVQGSSLFFSPGMH